MSSVMLENLKIAKPCSADWNGMSGDDRVRFCGQCKLNVYNLSGMTRDEAENLLSTREGSVCVRLYKRADGTVITRDCPVGLAALRRRVATLGASLFALLAVTFSSFFRTGEGIDGSNVEGPGTSVSRDPEPPVRPPEVLMGAAPVRLQYLEPEPTPRGPARETSDVKSEKE